MMAGRFAHRNQGFVLLSIFLLVLLALGVYAFTRLNSGALRTTDQDAATRVNHARIRDALVNFVSANRYLPCPANGTTADGLAVPPTATAACANPDGVVPWATLGLSAAEVVDAYQNKISYRVYAGMIGLTRAEGMTIVNCDSIRAPLPVPQPVGADVNSFCRIDHDTSPAQFLQGKGMDINDAGLPVSSVAFILISHGRNGAGAFNAAGVRNVLPDVASAEFQHTQAAGPFIIKASNTVELAPSNVNYFDDELSYLTISDLAARAKVAARDWADPP